MSELNVVMALMLTFTLLLLGGAFVSLLIVVGRMARTLMWFHTAGQSLAQHELRKAELDVELAKAQANERAAELRHSPRASPGRFAGTPTRMSVTTDPVVHS